MQKNNIIKLLFSFSLAVFVVVAVLNLIFGLIVYFFDHTQSIWWHTLSPTVLMVVLTLVFVTALIKLLVYKHNGQVIAEYLKAIRIEQINGVPEEILALKLNTEIAELCGVSPAHLYVLTEEQGINALTVGYSAEDVTIILTWGALQSMDQDELKGMLSYEYCHILSGSYVKHTQLEVLLSGLIVVSQWGSRLVVKGTKRKALVMDSKFAAIYVALGSFIWLIGSLGVLVSRLLKFILFYHREYKTDEKMCEMIDQQYLLHALTRVYVHEIGSQIYRVESESLAHYCFANALTEQSWFKVHPLLSQRINRLHPHFSRKAVTGTKRSFVNWQSLISKILLPTNEDVLLASLDAQQWQMPQPLPILRLSPISFAVKDAIRPLNIDIRQTMERPELLQRAMQTATGSREVIIAIFMIRQYREFIPEDAQVSKAIVDALLKLDGRIHIQIFHEALANIDHMPPISSRQFLTKIAQIIQADGEIGLLDCLLLDRVKATQGLLEDALPVSRQNCIQEIVHLVDALLHVQQINSQNQLYSREKILKQVLTYRELKKYQVITDMQIDLGHSLHLISGLLVRERLYLLTVAEHCLWADRIITQDELDVLELLYWRLGFETDEVVNRMLKQSRLLIP